MRASIKRLIDKIEKLPSRGSLLHNDSMQEYSMLVELVSDLSCELSLAKFYVFELVKDLPGLTVTIA